jgi:flavorubredoxin
MKTANNKLQTFIVTGAFSPNTLPGFFKDLDDQVNDFIQQEEEKIKLGSDKVLEVISVSDNVFHFKEELCRHSNDSMCNFMISRAIVYKITEKKELTFP